MQVIELSMRREPSLASLQERLKAEGLQEGDHIKVALSPAEGALAIAALAILFLAVAHYFVERQRATESLKKAEDRAFLASLEQRLFGQYATLEDLERSIEEEFGVRVSRTSPDAERDDWHQLALEGMSGSYAAHEPDYSGSVVKEPNPNYGKLDA